MLDDIVCQSLVGLGKHFHKPPEAIILGSTKPGADNLNNSNVRVFKIHITPIHKMSSGRP